MSNEKYIQIRQKVPIDSDGTVFKEFNVNEKIQTTRHFSYVEVITSY